MNTHAAPLKKQISQLQTRADEALRQVNHRSVIDLRGFDQQAKLLCEQAEQADYDATTKADVTRDLGTLIRTLDDLEREMTLVINQGKTEK